MPQVLQAWRHRPADGVISHKCAKYSAQMIRMATGKDQCGVDNAPLLFQCGGKKQDHRQCCREKGVHKTAAGEKCV